MASPNPLPQAPLVRGRTLAVRFWTSGERDIFPKKAIPAQEWPF